MIGYVVSIVSLCCMLSCAFAVLYLSKYRAMRSRYELENERAERYAKIIEANLREKIQKGFAEARAANPEYWDNLYSEDRDMSEYPYDD